MQIHCHVRFTDFDPFDPLLRTIAVIASEVREFLNLLPPNQSIYIEDSSKVLNKTLVLILL